MDNSSLRSRVKWLKYRGVEVLSVDFSNIDNSRDMIALGAYFFDFVENEKKQLLIFTNLKNSHKSIEIYWFMMRNMGRLRPYRKMSARIGIDNVHINLISKAENLLSGSSGNFISRKKALDFLSGKNEPRYLTLIKKIKSNYF